MGSKSFILKYTQTVIFFFFLKQQEKSSQVPLNRRKWSLFKLDGIWNSLETCLITMSVKASFHQNKPERLSGPFYIYLHGWLRSTYQKTFRCSLKSIWESDDTSEWCKPALLNLVELAWFIPAEYSAVPALGVWSEVVAFRSWLLLSAI